MTLLQRPSFAINPAAKVSYVFAASNPIIIIDDFYEHPDAIRDFALSLKFRKSPRCQFPGIKVRAPLPLAPITHFLKQHTKLLLDEFLGLSAFSLYTFEDRQLTVNLTLPHADSRRGQDFTAIV